MKITLVLLFILLGGCTYGHRDAKLDWSPGPSPAYDCSHCDGQHDFEIIEEDEDDELLSETSG